MKTKKETTNGRQMAWMMKMETERPSTKIEYTAYQRRVLQWFAQGTTGAVHFEGRYLFPQHFRVDASLAERFDRTIPGTYYVTGLRRDPSDGEIRRFYLTVAGEWTPDPTLAELFTRLTLAQQRMDQFRGSYVARSI
jgi:hypothetical protein